MFDSVLARRTVPRGKLLGAGLSIAVYAFVALGLLLGLSHHRAETARPVEVTLFTAAPPPPPAPAPPPPPPPAAGNAHHAAEKKPIEKPIEKKPDTVMEPTDEKKVEEPAPVSETKPGEVGGVPGGVTGGVPGGVVGGVLGGTLGGVVGGVPGGTGNAVLPFGAGMTRPQQIAGGPPGYTPQAIAARVEGKLLVRCVITASGEVQNCNVIKGLPMLDQAVLDSLRKSRFTPVTLQGRPVAVQYLFTFNFKLP